MRGLIVAAGMATLAMAAGAQGSSLNKCIDAQGGVTYSNLPCRNAKQVQAVEIDPAPPAPPAHVQPAKPATPPKQAATPAEPAPLRFEAQRTSGKQAHSGSARQCDAIADKLGSVLDKMDAARRKGYTQEQANAWNEQIQALERKKQQAGCF